MNREHARETFCRYSAGEKTDFLLRLAHGLTILARDTYEPGGDGLANPPRMRLINEVQHRVTSFLIALSENDLERYPDDLLARIILEHPGDPELERQVQETFTRLLAQMSGVA